MKELPARKKAPVIVAGPAVEAPSPSKAADVAEGVVAPPPPPPSLPQSPQSQGAAAADDVKIAAWLTSINSALVSYEAVFVDEGYENVGMLKEIEGEEDREELLVALDAAGIKKPHRKKIQKALQALCGY